ncbi:BTAD domain-containing putative transcriptional regulator [Micromonospora sp. URMC 103]|uniref:BTAD domain-containing putative transcriptional regulator n=1 Tax=Micromonospora sp. URMC 103 TaxID=3423406 RepID=UPI003F1D9950
MSGTLRFEVLGPQRAWYGERELDTGPGKQRAVLAVLLLSPGRPVPTGQIIEAVWPEDPPANGPNVVQKYVAGLRRVLEPGRSPRTPGQVLTLTDAGYLLRVPPESVDAVRFERDVRRAQRLRSEGRTAQAVAELRSALESWRGEPFAGLPGPLFDSARHRLVELRAAALETRADLDLDLGRHRELVGELVELVADFPLRERLRHQLMLALYRSGRHAEALAAYRDHADLLREEFGIEPGEGLQELHRRILRSDPTLLPAAEVAASPAEPAVAPPPDVPAAPASSPAAPASSPAAPASSPAVPGTPPAVPAAPEPPPAAPAPPVSPPAMSAEPPVHPTVLPAPAGQGAAPPGGPAAPPSDARILPTSAVPPPLGAPSVDPASLPPYVPPAPTPSPLTDPVPSQRGTRRGTTAPRWASATATVVGTLLVLLSFGCSTWLVMLAYAAWRRSWRLALAGVGYLALVVVELSLLDLENPEAEPPMATAALFVGLAAISLFVGAAHVIVLNRGVWATLTGGKSIAKSREEERRLRREHSRYLLYHYPAARGELRIGRPDLPRSFDDGGLIDVNSVPEHVLARLPGLSADQCRHLAVDRWLRGPYASIEELAGRCMLPPNLTEPLRDLLVFLPPMSVRTGGPAAPPES